MIRESKWFELSMFIAVLSTARALRDGDGWLPTEELFQLLPEGFWRAMRRGDWGMPRNRKMFLGQMLKVLERKHVLVHMYREGCTHSASNSLWRPAIKQLPSLSLDALPLNIEITNRT